MVYLDDIDESKGKYFAYKENGRYWQINLFDKLETAEKIKDVKQQFALILSISDRRREDIETHMRINGYDCVCDIY